MRLRSYLHASRQPRLHFVVLASLTILVCYAGEASAGDYVGLPFLRVGAGSRAATTGGFGMLSDDAYAVFYNPASLGFARRWGWAASYTRWIADTYDASLVVHRQFAVLGSKKSFATLGLRYFGAPTWDSTEGGAPGVSASHMAIQLAAGQRVDYGKLGFLKRHLAGGLSLRVVRSDLAGYSGLAVHSTVGTVLRLGRFRLGTLGFGVLQYGEVYMGGTIGNAVGYSRAFDQQKTRLPRTWNAAGSMHLAGHGNWDLVLSYQHCQETGGASERALGVELVWNRLVRVQVGYWPDNPADKLAFGLGLIAEGLKIGFPSFAGLQNSHLRFDVSGGYLGEILGWTQRSTIANYPGGPEPFAMISPREEDIVDGPSVHFSWEAAEDPDLADELEYILIVDLDIEKLRAAVRELERGDLEAIRDDSLLICTRVRGTSVDTSLIPVGTLFYWSMAAVDPDGHVRVAHGSPQLRRFRVRWPDLSLESIRLDPTPWLTGKNNPEQGQLVVTVRNAGERRAEKYTVQVRWVCLDSLDMSVSAADTLLRYAGEDTLSRLLGGSWEMEISRELGVGATTEVRHNWKCAGPGTYRVYASVSSQGKGRGQEVRRSNNYRFGTIVTVPKWTEPEPFRIPAKSSFKVSIIRYKSIAVPLVPMVFFAPGQAEVSPVYVHGDPLPAVLEVIARRMAKFPNTKVTLKGFVDKVSEPRANAELAMARARAVKRELTKLGVDADRIEISKAHNVFRRRILRRARTEQDALWIGEENRRVEMATEPEFEKVLFGPIELHVQPSIAGRDPRTERPEFRIRVGSAAGVRKCLVEILKDDRLIATLNVHGEFPAKAGVGPTLVHWDGRCEDGTAPPAGTELHCRVRVEDGLGRKFVTHEQKFILDEVSSLVREEIFALFKFADVEVPFRFYLDQLGPIAEQIASSSDLRVRFEGHADATGPEDENTRLSKNRAREITDAFQRILRQRYPERYVELVKRVDPPRWFGESVPLVINIAGQRKILVGDNSDPVGRNRNRRVMILVYRERASE